LRSLGISEGEFVLTYTKIRINSWKDMKSVLKE